MGLLGGGDDSLSASSGWGMMPPMNSSSDWGSSSNTGVGGGGGNATSSSGVITNHWQASSNTGSNGSASAGGGSSLNSTNSNSINVAGRQNALSNHNSANDQLLSSSPKPSSSWAQAAGKGLVNATASTSGSSSTNGPIISSSSSNSHDQPLSSYSNATATMAGNSQQSSASSSSSQGATNANLNGGPVGMSANSSNNASSNNPNSSSSAFQSSSNSNTSTGGLIGGSSSNPIDAAVVNKQRSGPSGSSGGISDLIGQLSDDFRETLLTEKWGSTVINQDSSWNLPPSPQSSPKDTSTWRCPVNSGTEIWENAVRHKKGSVGGSSAASLSSVTLSSAQPWSHTPTTHIGGTWGEEEDSSNHWTGVPQSSSLNSVSGGNGNGGGLSGGFGGAGPSGLSALGGVNSSSINNNWSAGSGMSNGTGSGISGYPLLNNSGGIGLGANSISGLGPDNSNSGGNSWNNGCNDKSAFESRSKGPNWNNFGDQVDSSSEPNWDKSMGGGNDFGTWPDKKDTPSWDRDSNDSQKGGVDDGTACWGNPRGVVNPSRTVPSWKDNKFGGNNNNNKNGFNNGWSANGGNGGNKSSNQSQMLNRTWTDASGHRKSPSLWNDDTKSLNGNMTPNNMSDGQIDTSSWFNSKPTKPLTREMILSSKQFRLLVDLGFKKDDVENTLRNYQMRFDDALMDLEQNKSFKTTSALGVNPNAKMQQSNRNQFLGGGGNGSSAMLNAQSMANNNSLQNLVQRIQLAVSTGFLNPQILNQPLSNQNLEIISELLHQIKLLKEVQMSATLPNLNAGAKSQLETKSFHIKQNISMLQNQLRSEQPGQGQGGKVGLQSNDFFKSNNDLYGGLNEYGAATGGGSQGSRLHSWKQSSYNKQQSNEEKLNALGAEFSRAPGGLSKQSSTSSNWGNNFMGGSDDGGWPADLGQLTKPHEDDYFGQQDFDTYKWKSAKGGMMDDDPRSPISQNAIVKESMFSWTSGSAPKTNSLLGGNGNGGGQSQMDSLNSSFGFGGGSSNPWSYNSNGASQSANSQMFTDLNKKPTVNKSTWGNQGLNSDYPDSLWNTGANSGTAGGSAGNGGAGSGAAGKPRPPPGLSQVKNSNSSNSNSIWNSGLSSSNTNSEYLRLRNLTPQIDGSTLKTLCCQHGPLLLFHLFLNHGTAIARYQARDQAIKAQSALNNCVLGNTTILADLPAESEVQQYLQLINGGGHSSNISGGQQSSNGSNGGGVHGGSSGHHSHQSQQQQSQSAQSSQQQAQSHHQHHAAHHSQPYNSSWSNGTNASQSTAGAGAAGSAGAQSTNPQSQHNSLYNRANSVSGGQNSASAAAAHLSPFGTAPAAINSFSSLQSTSSPASTLPYGAGGAGAPGLVTTHSSSSLPYHNVLNQASAASAAVAAASQYNKMDNGLLSSWNTGTGSNNLWDSSSLGGPVGGAAGLWSSAGFSAADRNTPIQNFLPGDLLAGENN